jgi:hypothetical protein
VKNNIIAVVIFLGFALVSGAIVFTKDIETPVSKSETLMNEAPLSKSNVLNIYNEVSTSLPPHDLYCIPETKSHCSIDGCKNADPNIFVIIGGSLEKDFYIARCDAKPCDVYPAEYHESGAFLTIETIDPHGMLFRLSSIDKSFVEVVSLGTDTLVSNGHCYSK